MKTLSSLFRLALAVVALSTVFNLNAASYTLSFVYSQVGSEDQSYNICNYFDKDKIILDSDFGWNKGKDDVCNRNNGGEIDNFIMCKNQVKACSRKDYTFTQTTLTLTLATKCKYHGTYTAPTVTINGVEAAFGSVTFDTDFAEKTLTTTMTITAGTHDVSVNFAGSDKFYASTLTITEGGDTPTPPTPPTPEDSTCTNTKTLQCETDYVTVTGGEGTPGKMQYITSDHYYAGSHGTGYIDHKDSRGETYYAVNLLASTYAFDVWCTNGGNRWMNIYKKGAASQDGTITYDNNSYGKLSFHDLGSGNDEPFSSRNIANLTLEEGDYILGLFGEGWAAFDQIVITAAAKVFCGDTITPTPPTPPTPVGECPEGTALQLGDATTLWSSSFDKATNTVTFNGEWAACGWELADDWTAYDNLYVRFASAPTGSIVLYVNGDTDAAEVGKAEAGTDSLIANLKGITNVSSMMIKSEVATSVTLTCLQLRTNSTDPTGLEPIHQFTDSPINQSIIEVFTLTGQPVHRFTDSPINQFPFSPGVYIIRYNGNTTKLMVR